jgi:hypothetical protein
MMMHSIDRYRFLQDLSQTLPERVAVFAACWEVFTAGHALTSNRYAFVSSLFLP